MSVLERRKTCPHPHGKFIDKDVDGRYGWIRSVCGECGKFMGYRPEDCEKYYKQNRYIQKIRGRDREE